MKLKDYINFKKNLTVLILCGGKGLRLRPLTKDTPKPLIKVKNKSILENIIRYFIKFKVNDFIIATGYKHKIIDQFIKKKFKNPNVRTFYTGLNSDIVERIKKSSKYSKKYLLICYGDTLIDININKYIKFFMSHPKKVTVASYQLDSSFGIFNIQKKNQIIDFKEKPILDIWFNVGYFLFSVNNFKLFSKFKKFKDLLKYLSRIRAMKTYKHFGNHVTVNTLAELEKAKKISVNFIK
jgi:glucose-1-phosphate cytidylyltransferase